MIQGSVNTTATPVPTLRPDQGSHSVEYTMFVVLALLLVMPCLVYCWKVGGLREFCCYRRTTGPLTHGQDSFVDNMERAVGVGAFVGHPGGGPHYRLMSHPQLLFVHGQRAQGTPVQPSTAPVNSQRVPKSVSFSTKPGQTAAAHIAVVCEPTAPLATLAVMQTQETKAKPKNEQA